jgi:putative ABC transport system permease protein
MFTHASLGQFAVPKAVGATTKTLMSIVCVQAGFCALVGTRLGLGMCAIAGAAASRSAWYEAALVAAKYGCSGGIRVVGNA